MRAACCSYRRESSQPLWRARSALSAQCPRPLTVFNVQLQNANNVSQYPRSSFLFCVTRCVIYYTNSRSSSCARMPTLWYNRAPNAESHESTPSISVDFSRHDRTCHVGLEYCVDKQRGHYAQQHAQLLAERWPGHVRPYRCRVWQALLGVMPQPGSYAGGVSSVLWNRLFHRRLFHRTRDVCGTVSSTSRPWLNVWRRGGAPPPGSRALRQVHVPRA